MEPPYVVHAEIPESTHTALVALTAVAEAAGERHQRSRVIRETLSAGLRLPAVLADYRSTLRRIRAANARGDVLAVEGICVAGIEGGGE